MSSLTLVTHDKLIIGNLRDKNLRQTFQITDLHQLVFLGIVATRVRQISCNS